MGIPIHLDPLKRKIVAASDEKGANEVWHPSNVAARRLWACVEVLRDINDLLEDAANAKNSGKRKRRAKIIAGYTHTLAKAVDALCKTIVGERDIRNQLGKDTINQVRKIQEDFAVFIPFNRNESLSEFRNKLVAHLDDTFWPSDASELLNSIPTHKIGAWLHICIHVVVDLTKLDIYTWSCESDHEGHIRLMTNEPFIVTMKVNDETSEIETLDGVDIANESPRETVQKVVTESIELSQWMFKKGQSRIRNLKEDSKENWNTFAQH